MSIARSELGVCVITGGGRGIGAATARRAARAGWRVCLSWSSDRAAAGAVDTLTLGLAQEVAAEGIRVNAVRPGLIETGIHASGGEPGRPRRLAPTIPLQRVGRPEEVAAAIVWLLGDDSPFTTGAILDVSGGR